MSNKLLVIGLDADSFNLLDPLIEKGFLPKQARRLFDGADESQNYLPVYHRCRVFLFHDPHKY